MNNVNFLTAADFTCLFSAILCFQSVFYLSLEGCYDCLPVVVQNILKVALYQHLRSCSHIRTKVKKKPEHSVVIAHSCHQPTTSESWTVNGSLCCS